MVWSVRVIVCGLSRSCMSLALCTVLSQEESKSEENMPLLSLCMIVKNESAHLARCLDSARDTVDEIVIVDTGSTDDTVAIAERYGARVLHFPWINDFSAARNVSLEAATGDWALILDADEALSSPKGAALRDRLQATDAAGFRLVVRNLTDGEGLSAFEDALLTRLFRLGPHIRYEQRIHEQIRPAIERQGGRVEDSDILVLHYGYAGDTAQGGTSRIGRNLDLLRSALEASPDDPYLYFQLGVTLNASSAFAEAEQTLLTAVSDARLDLDARIRSYAVLSQLALRENRVQDADFRARACLRDDPNNAVALYVAAYCAVALGRQQEALPLLDRVIAHPALSSTHRPLVERLRVLCAGAKTTV